MAKKFNVIADDWANGKYCLAQHVDTLWLAEIFANKYRLKYEGKPYPNGKKWYACRNFRAVEVVDEVVES